jgi:hypothetical protein
LPCNAITGRSGAVCPGGLAIAQFVVTPPRAAETNEPEVNVGAGPETGVAGSNGGGGASGAPTLVIDNGGVVTAGSTNVESSA